MWQSKRVKEFQKLVDKDKRCTLSEALEVLKKVPKVKFDQTVELSFKLNINTNDAPASVRGTVSLPHGTGKTRKVAVFCKGEYEKKAKEAGAQDYLVKPFESIELVEIVRFYLEKK